MISKDNAYARIKRSGNLPALPEILLKLLDVCEDESVPLTEIAGLISKDPVLSFRVLQLVNSAYYGLRTTFTSIEQAVVYLGSNSIKNIVVTTSIHEVFERKRYTKFKNFNISQFWYHSLLCATISKRIAQKTGFASQDEAYLSGLLHDIGKLILISTFPKEHETILADTADVQNILWAEKQLIGITHCDVGSWMVQKWKLNSMMGSAIQYHHEPLEKIEEAFPLVKIVYLSNLLSDEKQNKEGLEEISEQLVKLDATDLNEINEGAKEELEEIANSLNISVQPPCIPESKENTCDASSADSNLAEEIIPSKHFVTEDELDLPKHSTAQSALTDRVKNFSLLSTFLKELVQAETLPSIMATFEDSMSTLFDIEKVLFFLPDKEGLLLRGITSSSNDLKKLAEGLTLPIGKSLSIIVKAFSTGKLTFLSTGKEQTIADSQILLALGSKHVVLVPAVIDKKSCGLILLALPDASAALPQSDLNLIQIFAQQVGMNVTLERIKEEKKAEIESERMAAISLTASKFAHEINNPLGIISNYLKTLKLKLNNETNIHEEIGIIGEELDRISALVGQMDMVSQPVSKESKMADVNEIITSTINFINQSLPNEAGIMIHSSLDATLPKIKTSPNAIKQAILNLLKNASEAIGNDGRIDVTTRKTIAGTEKNREMVEIVISDNGPGLPESVLNNIYKPFITTKGEGHSGLGLSIVHKAIHDLGGSVSCNSSKDDGTSFTLLLPL